MGRNGTTSIPGGRRAGGHVLLAAACFLTAFGAVGAQETPPPNIVLIVADDLGYGDLSCYGQRQFLTPNIDRLATEGMKFTDFYAGSTVCAPSRCVLMTGLHTGHCLIRGNSKQNLRAGDITVAEMLQGAGYVCGGFGKWGLGHEATGGQPVLQGFDTFYGYFDQTHAHNSYPTFLMRDRGREPLENVVPNETPEGAGVATGRNQFAPDLIVAESLKFIDDHTDRPFFLYLPVTIPHANNEGGADGMEVPELGRFEKEDWPEPEKRYAALVTRLDRDVAAVLDRLEIHGLTGRTIVFFTSDNGPHHEGGHDPEFFDSNGPFQGIKRDLHEGGIRVPLLVRCPGRVEAGSVSSHWGYFGDLFSTFCDLAGARRLPNLDSLSIAPTLLGRADEQEHPPYLYWEFHEGKFSQAARHGEWKAIRSGGEGSHLALYNLVDDPGETTDISDRESKVARQMAGFMKEAHRPSPDWPDKTGPGKKNSPPKK